jgi:Tol biopolymer transport system component
VDTVQLTFDEAEIESIDVSQDGRLVVSSDRSGNWDLWTLPASGGDLQQLTTDPALDAGPRWKPDGSEIAFYSSRTGHREVWVMPVGGGPARQITRGESESYYPTWSPDGQEMVKFGTGISVVPNQGGEERRLTRDSRDLYPEWSPDGKWVVFTSNRDGAYRLWRVPASGGQAERLTKGHVYFHRWSLDGKQIYYIESVEDATKISALSIDSRQERAVATLIGRRGFPGDVALATDARYLYFAWGQERGDIWVADIVQSPGK